MIKTITDRNSTKTKWLINDFISLELDTLKLTSSCWNLLINSSTSSCFVICAVEKIEYDTKPKPAIVDNIFDISKSLFTLPSTFRPLITSTRILQTRRSYWGRYPYKSIVTIYLVKRGFTVWNVWLMLAMLATPYTLIRACDHRKDYYSPADTSSVVHYFLLFLLVCFFGGSYCVKELPAVVFADLLVRLFLSCFDAIFATLLLVFSLGIDDLLSDHNLINKYQTNPEQSSLTYKQHQGISRSVYVQKREGSFTGNI